MGKAQKTFCFLHGENCVCDCPDLGEDLNNNLLEKLAKKRGVSSEDMKNRFISHAKHATDEIEKTVE